MDDELQTYTNRTAHGGINTRLSGRLISDTEFTSLVNVDISVPGRRTKKKAPKALAFVSTLTNTAPCSGEFAAVDTLLGWEPVPDATEYEVQMAAGDTLDDSTVLILDAIIPA
jgi:hypothetical protein